MVHRFLARAVAFVVIAVLVAGCGGGLKNEYHREMEDRYPGLADLQLETADRTLKTYSGGATQSDQIFMVFVFDESVHTVDEVLEEIKDKAAASGMTLVDPQQTYRDLCAAVPSTIGELDLVFSVAAAAYGEPAFSVSFTYGGGASCR